MSFRVIPVPAYGCEDVAVATHGPDEGAVFTGTEDGSIWRIRDEGRQVDRVARDRWPPARHRVRRRRPARGLRRHPWPAPRRPGDR